MGDVLNSLEVPLSFVVASGCTTLALATALTYILRKPRSSSEETAAPKEEETTEVRNIDKEKYPGGALHVFYGTQTGTSESFAQILQRDGEEHGFLVRVEDLEDVELETLMSESRRDPDSGILKAIFLMATYGEGEPTDNATAFYNGLQQKLPKTTTTKEDTENEEKKEEERITENGDTNKACFVGMEYSVFGLGNREYDQYNSMGKFFDFALEQVGGSRVVTLALGDDNSDIEGDFEKWKDKSLWPTLKKKYVKETDGPKKKRSLKKKTFKSKYDVVFHADDESSTRINEKVDQVPASSKNLFTSFNCPITTKYELRTPKDSGSTMHCEIDISNAKGLEYNTADNLGILPENRIEDVEMVVNSLGYDLDATFSLKAAASQDWSGAPFPMPITVRECFIQYLDITTALRRSDLKLLAGFATDPLDEKALLRMASKEGKSEFRQKIVDEHVGLVQLLKLCPSIQCPLGSWLSFCPLMHPRYYTISSSSSVHPKTVHVTVALTEAKRTDGTTFQGLCTGSISNREVGETIRIFNRPSTFKLPDDPTTPIIMIGPGTGIAPMRAFLQERSHQHNEKNGDNILYFGCKRRDQDYIYENELEQYKADGVLTELHLAFSREGDEKVYVQHKLAKHSKQVWNYMEQKGAYIYVCGGVKMGHDISETLKKIISDEGDRSKDEAKDYLEKLASNARYVQELWS